MHDPASFTDDENWSGGFYELAIEIGDRSDELLELGLSALWRAAAIDGCYGRRDREPGEEDEVSCTVSSLAEFGHLRGTVALPSGRRVVCGCLAIREDDGTDWLAFYLPVGALSRVDTKIGGFRSARTAERYPSNGGARSTTGSPPSGPTSSRRFRSGSD
ncbi:hypothetical protein [Streptomyces sp. NPDC059874]|uniref:hypothetical protein n=1 Tax=Streptomyces sp. NPDC059874 TaxID=3346983 RepID=UPI00365A9A7D